MSSVISVFQEPVKEGTVETILKVDLTVVFVDFYTVLNNSLTVSGLHLENSQNRDKYPLYNEKKQGPFIADLLTQCSENEHEGECNMPFLLIKWGAFSY